VASLEAEAANGAKTGESMKKRDVVKKAAKTVSKKKGRASEVPSDEEIKELESMEIPEKVKREVCHEVAKKMGISVKEVRELMEKLESDIPFRKLKK
jgi:predicted nucleic acid-binding protein